MKLTALSLAAAALLAVSASTPLPAEAKAPSSWYIECGYDEVRHNTPVLIASTPQQIPEMIAACLADGGSVRGILPVLPGSKY